MKDVKTKPKNVSAPKDKVKSQKTFSNAAQDIKTNLKNQYIHTKAEAANKNNKRSRKILKTMRSIMLNMKQKQ